MAGSCKVELTKSCSARTACSASYTRPRIGTPVRGCQSSAPQPHRSCNRLMEIHGKKKIVLLGMMSRMPVAGNMWLVAQYLVGFRRLGYDPYYIEAHARTPYLLMEGPGDDSSAKAASFLDRFMRRFDLADHWAFHALHDN